MHTYSSFMGIYGPGPIIKEEFEKICECIVVFINAGDSGLILQRLKVLEDSTVDLIIGLDQFTFDQALLNYKWKSIETKEIDWIDVAKPYLQEFLIPFEWAPLTFIYKKGGNVQAPSSMDQFLKNNHFKKTLSLQDPRVSTPGLQFLFWISQFGDGDFGINWKGIENKIYSVSSSWSGSYGLFKKGEAQLTFSYLTSPVYHWVVENNYEYQPMSFEEGHPYQIEFMAIPDSCDKCDLANRLAKFILQSKIQKILAEKNYMLPVVNDVDLREEFSLLPNVQLLGKTKMDSFIKNKNEILKKWVRGYRNNQ